MVNYTGDILRGERTTANKLEAGNCFVNAFGFNEVSYEKPDNL